MEKLLKMTNMKTHADVKELLNSLKSKNKITKKKYRFGSQTTQEVKDFLTKQR